MSQTLIYSASPDRRGCSLVFDHKRWRRSPYVEHTIENIFKITLCKTTHHDMTREDSDWVVRTSMPSRSSTVLPSSSSSYRSSFNTFESLFHLGRRIWQCSLRFKWSFGATFSSIYSMSHFSSVYVNPARKYGSRGFLTVIVLAPMFGTWRAEFSMPSPI